MTAKDINDFINEYYKGYSFNFRCNTQMIDGAYYKSLDEEEGNVFDGGRYDDFDALSMFNTNDINKFWVLKEDILVFIRNRKLENLLNEV